MMKNVNVMIKPASGNCQMRCRYCFYADITDHREVKSYGIMSESTLEHIVKSVVENAEEMCTFAFQGGEPTLVGLDYYKKLIEYQEKFAHTGLKIYNVIQTNGYHITEEWAEFFAQNHFLVGISVDGTKEIHDGFRVDSEGKGTYSKVKKTISLLDRYHVDYNILTVVTKQSARHIYKIYQDYKKNGWKYLQFIPCLDEYKQVRGKSYYSLTIEAYEAFLKQLFDLWYEDLKKNEYIYIRYFENLVGMVMGIEPESCSMRGSCVPQLVVEADGSVYPCDFYVMDEYRMGNFNHDELPQLLNSPNAIRFLQESIVPAEECRSCQYAYLCRGGCRRDRDYAGDIKKNYYCKAYISFFNYALPRLREIAEMYRAGKI